MNIYSMQRDNCKICYNCGKKKPNCEKLVVYVTKSIVKYYLTSINISTLIADAYRFVL